MTADASSSNVNSYTLLTSIQPAAIAVIRVSGSAFDSFASAHLRFVSASALARLSAGDVRRASLCDTDGEPIDDVIVSVRSPGPEWDIWLHLHGSPWIARRCGELLAAAGFAEVPPRGESLFPASDLLAAAIAERLPSMLTLAGVRWLNRQLEVLPRFVHRLAAAADQHPRLVRRACASLAASLHVFDWYSRPLRIALVGPPNAGKSTLFNRLVGDSVSIISPYPGTTRDWVEAPAEIAGFPVTWIDTAGVFEATDPLDAAGVAAAMSVSLSADLRVAVLDATELSDLDIRSGLSAWLKNSDAVLINKSDAENAINSADIELHLRHTAPTMITSALNGRGINDFLESVLRLAGRRAKYATRPAVFTSEQVASASAASAHDNRNTLKNMVLRIVA